MGIPVEFNPELVLREFGAENRLEEECVPKNLKPNQEHTFLKTGQRNYWLEGEIPLRVINGDRELSRPLASVTILKAMHFLVEGAPYTKGVYSIGEVYDISRSEIHFEGMEKVNRRS